MKIKYHYNNWEVTIFNNEIYLQARIGNLDIGYRNIGRTYELPMIPNEVHMEGEYINLKYNNQFEPSTYQKTYQFKLEGDSCIVGDIFDWDNNHIDEIAMYDLFDDWDEAVPTRQNISN